MYKAFVLEFKDMQCVATVCTCESVRLLETFDSTVVGCKVHMGSIIVLAF